MHSPCGNPSSDSEECYFFCKVCKKDISRDWDTFVSHCNKKHKISVREGMNGFACKYGTRFRDYCWWYGCFDCKNRRSLKRKYPKLVIANSEGGR